MNAEPTKRCPFCGEEILAVAIKCKHCQSSLPAVQQPGALPPHPELVAMRAEQPQETHGRVARADYGWAILGLPLAGVLLIWTWVANLNMLQGPGSALGMTMCLVVILTAAICAIEASRLGMRYDRDDGTYSPVQWGLSILALWIISYCGRGFKTASFRG